MTTCFILRFESATASLNIATAEDGIFAFFGCDFLDYLLGAAHSLDMLASECDIPIE